MNTGLTNKIFDSSGCCCYVRFERDTASSYCIALYGYRTVLHPTMKRYKSFFFVSRLMQFIIGFYSTLFYLISNFLSHKYQIKIIEFLFFTNKFVSFLWPLFAIFNPEFHCRIIIKFFSLKLYKLYLYLAFDC